MNDKYRSELGQDQQKDLYVIKRINQSKRSMYFSSTVDSRIGELGTIEADTSGDFGRWSPEPFNAHKMADLVLNSFEFSTVLDIGPGDFGATKYFYEQGKTVFGVEFDDSPRLDKSGFTEFAEEIFWGDFNTIDLPRKFDLVWASHVLEHQPNVGSFLSKLLDSVVEGGTIAIAVPPRKPYVISGHLNLFNPGLLTYRLVMAGIDCHDAKVFHYDGNVCLVVSVKKIELPKISYDYGDLDALSHLFPNEVAEGFNGDFMQVGLNQKEKKIVFGEKNVEI